MIDLRPATSADDVFLFDLYRESRAQEVAAWGWAVAEADAFLRMQYTAQRRYYTAQPGVEILIITRDPGDATEATQGRPIEHRCGRLIVVDRADELRLADIVVQAAHRRRGTGSAVLRKLMDRAHGAKKPLRLSVEWQNGAARRLYVGLGFVAIDANQTHIEMAWHAPPSGLGTAIARPAPAST